MVYKKMNKKGASLSGLMEMGIGMLLVLAIIVIIITSMNVQYGKSYDPTFGIASNDTQQAFNDYQGTIKTGTEGEATTNAISGVNVVSAYGIVRAGLRLMFDLVTGQFIINIVGLLNLGQAGILLGQSLRLLFIFAVGFILVKILFKVKI